MKNAVHYQSQDFSFERDFVTPGLDLRAIDADVNLAVYISPVSEIKRYNVSLVVMVQKFPVHIEEIIVIHKHHIYIVGFLPFGLDDGAYQYGNTSALQLRRARMVDEKIYLHLMLVSARESAMLLNMTSGPIRVKSPESEALSTLAYSEHPASRSTISPLIFPSASE